MDFSPIENFYDSTGRFFLVAKLCPTLQTCLDMDRLYRVGFGEDLPLLHIDHIRILENGTSFGIFNDSKEMIAFRSFLFDWRYSNPLDKPFFKGHENYFYSNHTVIHPHFRNCAVADKIAELTRKQVCEKEKRGMRTSVSPWNLRGLAFHGKSGFRITSFIPDLFGPGEHRFQMVLEKRDQPDWYKKRNHYKDLLLREKELPKDQSKSHNKYKVLKLEGQKNLFSENCDLIENLGKFLNEKYYEGIVLIPSRLIDLEEDENSAFLILENNKNKDLVQSTHFRKQIKYSTFYGLSQNSLFENIEGEYHTLEYALEHANQCFESAPSNSDFITFSDSLNSSPMMDDLDLGKFAESRLVKIYPNDFEIYKNIFAFDSTASFTGSIKDHATELVASFVKSQEHIEGLVLASTGNMGASEAAGMTIIGKNAHIFLPKSTPQWKIAKIEKFGGEVHVVTGNYDQAVIKAREFVQRNKQFIYGGETVLRLWGNALIAKVIVDLMEDYPDYLFIPVGDGAQYYGFVLGFTYLIEKDYLTLRKKFPKLIGVQVDGANPIYRSVRDGSDRIRPIVPKTSADAIAIGDPLYGKKIINWIARNPELGEIMSVSEKGIPIALSDIEKNTGILLEASSSVVWIALMEKIKQKQISEENKSVLLFTGGSSYSQLNEPHFG